MRTLALLGFVACGGGQPAPAPIGNSAPATRSSQAGIPGIDDAAFAHLLDTRAWAAVIDPAVGLVEMTAIESPADDADGEFWARRLCGERATTGADRIANAITRRAGGDLREHYRASCSPVGTWVECAQLGVGEYDLSYTFRFELRSGGYVLTGLESIDVGDTAEDVERNYESLLAKPDGC